MSFPNKGEIWKCQIHKCGENSSAADIQKFFGQKERIPDENVDLDKGMKSMENCKEFVK